jgi:hypothetical protein
MRTILTIFLFLFTWQLSAQELQFTASAAPNVLQVGEQFNLTYTADQELDEINVPEIRDFELLGGPSQGHSQSVYNANGKITTTSTWQYTYFFRAVKAGKFTIGPASAKFKNKTYRSNALTVEVIKGRDPAATQTQDVSQESATQPDKISDKDLYVSLILDKKEAYLGEQIMATVKIYSRVNLYGINSGFKGPDFTGFFTEPLDIPPLQNLQREAVNGDIYGTGILRKVVIIPQMTGELTIQPFELGVSLRREVRRKIADPFFEDFSIPEFQEIPITLKSKAVKIQVKALPPNPPSSFNGAVGNFKLTSSINKTSTKTHDPLTLKLSLTGKGNLKLINQIDVNVPYDMEKYDPVINLNLDNPLSGTKSFEYLIMPRVAGQFTLLPVEFTYFDIEARQYKTLKTQSYTIQVEKSQGDTLLTVVPGMTKEDVKLLNSDIRFIKTKPFRLQKINRFVRPAPVYYLLYLLALAVFSGIIWNHKRLLRLNADVVGSRLRKADKYARKRLKKSAGLLKQGYHAAFYEELLGAVWGYLSYKLNIPVATLSKDSAKTMLQQKDVELELIDRLFSVTDTCEMARYARGTGDIVMDQLYLEALDVITRLQQKLK